MGILGFFENIKIFGQTLHISYFISILSEIYSLNKSKFLIYLKFLKLFSKFKQKAILAKLS